MKKGWQTKKLADLVEVQNGYAFSSKDYSESGHFLMRIGNVQNGYISTADPKFIKLPADGSLQRFVLSEDDILVSLTGNVGRVGVIQESHLPAALNQRVARISIRKDSPATRELILLFLCSDWFREELIGAGHGAAQQNVSTKDLVEIEIPVPPLAEQQRIVGLLDEAFAGLATAKANAEKNLQNARALFESHLQSVFTQRGAGWVETTLGETCILRSGTTLPKEVERISGEVPYLKVADMNLPENLNGITSSSRYVDSADVNKSNLLPEGTTIFPKRGGSILTNKKRLTTRVICADLNIMGVTPKAGLLPLFLFNYFLGVDMRKINNGSSIPQINNYSIEPLLISFPSSLSEQKKIVTNLEELSDETQRLARLYERKHAALEALKKSLLHQAFSGEL